MTQFISEVEAQSVKHAYSVLAQLEQRARHGHSMQHGRVAEACQFANEACLHVLSACEDYLDDELAGDAVRTVMRG